ncbi:malonyl-CoA synthase [Rhodovulum sp. 12E13]|uniref:AMP-binding protein n=1 Tax=Rhodovulum sp. 12E13 TaxID=2203891 RepID=UPI000E158C62|nr:AMP-binding protein [Rhodovulum sp. 12E13]RDC74352.1 malonyl-CoA synthase [Rhodovulum sp. 12E13]
MANPLFDRLFAPHVGSDAPFLLPPGGGAAQSYGAFLEDAARIAGALAGLGLDPGDRVAVQVPKSARALALYAACVQAGLVFLPLNTAYTGAELAYFVENSGARALVCDPGEAARLAELAGRCGAELLTLGADGQGTLADLAEGQPARAPVVPRGAGDLAALLYTSGTTGRSKGAMLTQENLLSNALVLAEAWSFDGRDVLLHALPIFHTHGLFVATNVVLATGGAMIFMPAFEAAAALAELPRATAMMGVPTFYTRLLDRPDFTREAAGHMRLFTSGSAPLLAETHRAFERRTGHRILERYGMTETNMTTSNPYAGERRPGTVGPPLAGVDLRIVAEGREVPRGAVGEIEVRGPGVFAGYWGMPEKTEEEMTADGFFRTGDLAMQDADGYVTIVGRAKDLIISGGYNIYPREVEEVLDAVPGVREAAVIGVPHPDFGESPVAVVVAEPGGAPDRAALLAACGETLARFKHPREVIAVESLPRNAMGKVQKAELRARYADLFAPPASPE